MRACMIACVRADGKRIGTRGVSMRTELCQCESARRWEGDGGNTWAPETGTTAHSGLEQAQAAIRQVAGWSDVRGEG